MKILALPVFLLISLPCPGFGGISDRIKEEHVDGGDGVDVESPAMWTKVEKMEEEVVRLTERIFQATQRNRSKAPLTSLPAGRVTSTQVTFLDLLDLYLPNVQKVNQQCARDLLAILAAMANLDAMVKLGELWPLQLVDSWGKLGDGILIGNMKQPGFFKECLDISVLQGAKKSLQRHGAPLQHAGLISRLFDLSKYREISPGSGNENQDISTDFLDKHSGNRGISTDISGTIPANFSGKYCLVTFSSQGMLDPSPALRTASSSFVSFFLTQMVYGTCIPSTCTSEELRETVKEALKEADLKVNIVDCQVKDYHHPLETSEIVGIVLMTLLLFVLVLATCAEVLTSAERMEHVRNGPLRYLLAFSISSNFKKIMHLETRKLPGVISSINAIRVVSISWVVLGHQYLYSVLASQNPLDLVELSKHWWSQVVTNADLSVDTFFTLSGLLVTLALLTLVNKTGRFNLPLYLVHRFLRLWPPVALTALLVATLSGLPVSGPSAEEYWRSVVKGCRNSWWIDISLTTNLILPYINKLHKDPGEAASCLPHTWYLGVDTQLYLLMPIILLPLIWWPRKGLAWLSVWTAASVITPMALTGAYHLWPASMMVQDPDAMLQFNYKIYMMPWARAGPYFVGAWAGYIIYYGRQNPAITRLKLWQQVLGWLVAVSVALAVLFGIAPYNYLGTPSQVPEMSLAEAVLYGGLHRPVWAACVSWVIVACLWGYGGPVAAILEHPIWQPLSRLSYCIYLTSMPIQFIVLYSTKRLTFYSLYNKMQETAGVMVVIVAVSIVVSLISESPILRLEKMLLHGKGAQTERENRSRPTPQEVITPTPHQGQNNHTAIISNA